MLKRGRLLLALAVLLAAGGATAWTMRSRAAARAGGGADPVAKPPSVMAPAGVRIRVEVVNATRTRGLARRATMYLRDRGFDVVTFSTTSTRRDTTLVLDRSGNPEWARLVAEALGGVAVVEPRPDSSRYLDVTVLLGASWRPPTEPFYP